MLEALIIAWFLIFTILTGVHAAPKLAEWLVRKWLNMKKEPKPQIFYHPLQERQKPPVRGQNDLIFFNQKDIILAPSNSKINNPKQRISLGYRVQIPMGYMAVVAALPDVLLDSEDRISKDVVCHPAILHEGWTGEVFLEIENQSRTEPAGLEAGNRLANLALIKIGGFDSIPLIKE